MITKKSIMLVVSCKNWNWPKSILMEIDSNDGEEIRNIARKAFKKYKASQNEDIYLVDYSYHENC